VVRCEKRIKERAWGHAVGGWRSASLSLGQDATLSFVVRGKGKRKGIPLQTNEGQPFLLGSQPYGVGFGVGGGTLDSNEVVDLG